jgi:hypothetical protein
MTSSVWFQAVTLAIACLGALLGIVNTVHQLNKDKVRLKVVPKEAFPVIAGRVSETPYLCIEVINLSALPVTVSDAGLVRRSTRQRRLAVIRPLIVDGGPWPRRLEGRQSVSVYIPPGDLDRPELALMTKAYAKTDCGEEFYGKSPALRQFIFDRMVNGLRT